MPKPLTPYQKIMRAAKYGESCRLTTLECARLSLDTAISARAEADDSGEEEPSWLELAEWERKRGAGLK